MSFLTQILWIVCICISTLHIQASDNRTIQIDFGSEQNYCKGDLVSICPIITGATGNIQFLWEDGSQNSCFDFEADESGSISLMVLDETGAQTNSSLLYSVFEKPIASAGTDLSIFESFPVVLTASGGSAYLWNNGQQTQSITISPSETSQFSVTVYNENNCEDAATVEVYVRKYAKIEQYVWEDGNANGIYDSNENGLNGVVVNLHLDEDQNGIPDENAIRSTVTYKNPETGENGYFDFVNLEPNHYFIEFVRPIGFFTAEQNVGTAENLDSDAHFLTGFSETFNLQEGDLINHISAAYYRTGGIETRVFEDLDADGVQNLFDPGVDKVVIKLLGEDGDFVYDAGGAPVYTKFTGQNGICTFENLLPGKYMIEYSYGEEWYATSRDIMGNDIGYDRPDDSDLDPLSGRSNLFEVFSGEQYILADAGIYQKGGITSVVWNDENGNGIRDSIDMGIEGVKIYLYDANDLSTPVDSTTSTINQTSGETGYFDFDDLYPIDYYVYFITPDSYQITLPNIGVNDTLDSDVTNDFAYGTAAFFSLRSGEQRNDLSAGFYKSAKIGDSVWFEHENGYQGIHDSEDLPAPGIKVLLYDYLTNELIDSRVTDKEGKYLFDSVGVGYYYVVFDIPDHYTFVTPNLGFNESTDSDVIDYHNKSTGIIEIYPGYDLRYIDAGLALGVVPVKLNNFEVLWNKNRRSADISWQCESEINVAYYEIQRAYRNTDDFISISKVKCQEDSQLRYAYTDTHFKRTGNYYYRLRIVDANGFFEYSDIRQIEVNAKQPIRFSVFPNPSADWINLDTDELEISKIEVFDIRGRKQNLVTNPNTKKIDILNIDAGQYILCVTHSSGRISQSFVKQY